jgi:hypothetical protein
MLWGAKLDQRITVAKTTPPQRVLDLDIPLNPDHVVYDALPRMAENHPRESSRCCG